MAYCSLQDLTDRYGERMLVALSDRGELASTEPDAALFDRAIGDAAAAIDAYLAARYALPLASTPAIVRDIALRIAIYNAHGQTVSEKVKDDYKEALRQLQQISAGTMKLDVAGIEPAAAGGGAVILSETERPITAKSMKGWI